MLEMQLLAMGDERMVMLVRGRVDAIKSDVKELKKRNIANDINHQDE